MLTWVGEIFPEDVGAIHACLERMQQDHEVLFLVINAIQAGTLGRDARKRAASWPLAHRVGAVAIFGANRTVRAVTMIATALLKIFSPKSAISVEFLRTEQAARAWIDTRRSKMISSRKQAEVSVQRKAG